MTANGEKYEHNWARAAAYFLNTCAPEPTDAAQKAAYGLITGIYRQFFGSPEALGLKPQADVFFDPWEQQKGREKDIKLIRGSIDRIESTLAELFSLVEAASVCDGGLALPEDFAIGRVLSKALAACGCGISDGRLPLTEGCAAALKRLAAISRENTVHITDGPKEDKAYLFFSRCVFEPSSDWTARAFDGLLAADGCLLRLCEGLEKRGYARVDCRDGKRVSLDYHKPHGKKDEPLKAAWAERTHSGIEVSYEELRLEPAFLWLRMPDFTTVLNSEDRLPAETARFIASRTKNCDGCRYCVQTDKTHTRPLAAISFCGRKKCPRFPGFTMNWRGLDGELCGQLLDTLDAIDALYNK